MKKKLIIGLGNPGTKYENTRHNIGFKILDYLANKKSVCFESKPLAKVAKFTYKGCLFVLIKPTTFMNLSGKAVRYWLYKENMAIEDVLIICDDLHLDFGIFRLKPKGSAGGHNGLKDINEKLNTQNYIRFRFGVGANFTKGKQVDYVLGKWNTNQQKELIFLLEKSTDTILHFGNSNIQKTMNTYNGNHLNK